METGWKSLNKKNKLINMKIENLGFLQNIINASKNM